ncbi:MAG: PDZ domain-containing protein [Trichodesmium sp. MAG_R01]|nr:PDZ domain-containing protein [Trichodesmium sp. MAG_R01]
MPAGKAGLEKEDKILEIDGQSTKNMLIEGASNLIIGKENTKVSLTISRSNKVLKKTVARVPFCLLSDQAKGVYLIQDISINKLLFFLFGFGMKRINKSMKLYLQNFKPFPKIAQLLK